MLTIAVCWKCGESKFGAFTPCGKCKAMPGSEDDLALSLAMTDHYFDMATLKQMGASIASGNPPQLDPETRENLIKTVRQSGQYTGAGHATDISYQAVPQVKKSWWRRLIGRT
jgi:hypothetical protein